MGRSSKGSKCDKGSRKGAHQHNHGESKSKKGKRNNEVDLDLDIEQFNEFLKPENLMVSDVERDGNCVFRAVSDQLELHSDQHELAIKEWTIRRKRLAQAVNSSSPEMSASKKQGGAAMFIDDEEDGDEEKSEEEEEESSPSLQQEQGLGAAVGMEEEVCMEELDPRQQEYLAFLTAIDPQQNPCMACSTVKSHNSHYTRLREICCDYISDHEEDYRPFVENDIAFDHYINDMRGDGTWAGHMELQALCTILRCNIRIYMPGNSQPIELNNFRTKTDWDNFHDKLFSAVSNDARLHRQNLETANDTNGKGMAEPMDMSQNVDQAQQKPVCVDTTDSISQLQFLQSGPSHVERAGHEDAASVKTKNAEVMHAIEELEEKLREAQMPGTDSNGFELSLGGLFEILVGVPWLCVSYHHQEHYASVRPLLESTRESRYQKRLEIKAKMEKKQASESGKGKKFVKQSKLKHFSDDDD